MTAGPPTVEMRVRRPRRALAAVAATAVAVGAVGACGGPAAVPTERGAPVRTIVDDRAVGVPQVDAAAFAVLDAGTSTMLADVGADVRRPVGSLMKLLNAAVAYEAGGSDEPIVAPGGLAGSAGESVLGITAGQRVTRAVLIRAMLKVSANDAARLLALDIAGSEAAYASMMNETAASLGLVDTHAANASGLDADGQYSSARDVVSLAAALSANEEFRRTVASPVARYDGRTIPNTNDLLATYAGADGVKTGHTTGAGYCVVASATRDGRRIIVAVLGAPSEEARNRAAASLLDWAFASGGG